jgi:hypothetical protein
VIDLIDSDEDNGKKRKLDSTKTNSVAYSNFEDVYNAKSQSSTWSSKSSSSSYTSAPISSDEEQQRLKQQQQQQQQQQQPSKSSSSAAAPAQSQTQTLKSNNTNTPNAYSFKLWNIKQSDCLPREPFIREAAQQHECETPTSSIDDEEENSNDNNDKISGNFVYKGKYVSIGLFANNGQFEFTFNRMNGIEFTIRGA